MRGKNRKLQQGHGCTDVPRALRSLQNAWSVSSWRLLSAGRAASKLGRIHVLAPLNPSHRGQTSRPLLHAPLSWPCPLHQHPLMPRWTLLSHASGFSRQDPPAPPGCGPGQPSVHGTRPYPILHSSPDQRSRADPLSAVSSDFSSHGHMATSTAFVPEHKPAVDCSVM